jgi:hypothetical protein
MRGNTKEGLAFVSSPPPVRTLIHHLPQIHLAAPGHVRSLRVLIFDERARTSAPRQSSVLVWLETRGPGVVVVVSPRALRTSEGASRASRGALLGSPRVVLSAARESCNLPERFFGLFTRLLSLPKTRFQASLGAVAGSRGGWEWSRRGV